MTTVTDDTTIQLPIVPKHPHALCSGCPLYDVGDYVPSSQPTKPDSRGNQLAIVGEAPGENEVDYGKVFIGPSGKILNGTLRTLGIDRDEILVTNASACAYPKGRGPGKFDKLPPAAVEHCRPRLLWELEQAKVQTAVVMGAHAARSLLKTKEGISTVRAGGPKLSDHLSGLKVVATFHPAYALRQHQAYPHIVNDLCKIDDDVWDIWPGVNKRVIRTDIEASQEIVRLWNTTKAPLVCDTESGKDKDTVFGGDLKEVLCLGLWDEANWEVLIFPRYVFNDNVRKLLGKLFERNGLDGQHLKYDIGRVLNKFLSVDGPIDPRARYDAEHTVKKFFGDSTVLDIPIRGDTMLRSYVLCEASTIGIHGLKFNAREKLGAPRWDHITDENMKSNQAKAKAEAKARKEKIGKRFTGVDYSMIDDDVLHEYNAMDVGATRFLIDYFEPRIDATPGLRKQYEFLLDATQMLLHVEQRGIGIDEEYNLWLEKELRNKLGELCFETGLDRFNPNSPDQVKKFLSSIGLAVETTRADVIKDIVKIHTITGERPEVVDFCSTLLEHRGASKLLNTFVLGLRNAIVDGSVHPDFGLLTSTGRTRGKNPNPQNIPRNVGSNLPSMDGVNLRRQFAARPGNIYVTCDYGQAELRTMAWLAKDEGLRQLLSDPEMYVFDKIALAIFGAQVFNSWSPLTRKDMHGRLTKPLAYGSAYGRGPTAIAESFGISVAEARKIQQDFFALIPGVIKYQNEIKDIATGCGDLVTVFGRRRRFRLVTEQNWHEVCNEAMAHMPQSTASDICITSAIKLDRMGVPIVNLVHDQIIAEPDKREMDECARLMRKVMIETAEEVTEHYVPWVVDAEVGTSYGTFEKYKLAA